MGGITGNYVIGKKIDLDKTRQSGIVISSNRSNQSRRKLTNLRNERVEMLRGKLNKFSADLNLGIGIEHEGEKNIFLMEFIYLRNLTARSIIEGGKNYLHGNGIRIGFRYKIS